MNYLFNLFLHASSPLAMIMVFAIVVSFLVLPVIKKIVLSKKEFNNTDNTFIINYKLIKGFVWSFSFIACVVVVLTYAISPTITPKNNTFDKEARVEEIKKQYYDEIMEKSEAMKDQKLSTEDARVLIEKSPEQTKEEFNDMMNYTEPMYPENKNQKSFIEE